MSKRTRNRPVQPQRAQQRRDNAICFAVPLGEMVPTPFVLREVDTFVKALPQAAMIHAHGSYHQNTANQLVKDFLEGDTFKSCPYLVFYEHDMVPSENWIARVRQYDPDEHHIVGTMYFRRNKDDMRPIPGRWTTPERTSYRALQYDEVEYMISRPGFHPVDCCGLGATAISRKVLENWDPEMVPWFHTPIGPDAKKNPALCESHDVYFLRNAQTQGFNIFIDSAVLCDHYGWFPYALHTYRQGWYNSHRLDIVRRAVDLGAA